jgi:hypothetical protein
MSHNKKRALPARTEQGTQDTLHGNCNVVMPTTGFDQRIRQLASELDACAHAGDTVRYRHIWSQYTQALRERPASQMRDLETQHRDFVERCAEMGLFGAYVMRAVGASNRPQGGPVSWVTTRPAHDLRAAA